MYYDLRRIHEMPVEKVYMSVDNANLFNDPLMLRLQLMKKYYTLEIDFCRMYVSDLRRYTRLDLDQLDTSIIFTYQLTSDNILRDLYEHITTQQLRNILSDRNVSADKIDLLLKQSIVSDNMDKFDAIIDIMNHKIYLSYLICWVLSTNKVDKMLRIRDIIDNKLKITSCNVKQIDINMMHLLASNDVFDSSSTDSIVIRLIEDDMINYVKMLVNLGMNVEYLYEMIIDVDNNDTVRYIASLYRGDV